MRFNKIALKTTGAAIFALACLLTGQVSLAAEPVVDCALRETPFSSSLPAYDIMTRPAARAVVEKYYPDLFATLPAGLLSDDIPSFGTIITLDQLLARAGKEDDSQAPAMRKELAALPVTEADKEARCARFDVEPVIFELGNEPVQVLIFQKINGYDHGLSVTAATDNLTKLAGEMGYGVTVSAKGSAFTEENLAKFDVVVWNNVSGDALTLSQRATFEDYINKGGGFMGIHASAGDSIYFWDWYRDSLIGAQFIGHPRGPHQFQQATIMVDHHDTGIAADVPKSWQLIDEWYSFDRNPAENGYDVIMSLDESTYQPGDLAMGDDHPIVWSHCVGKGRAMYTAIGHRSEVYEAKNNIRLLKDGLKWTSGQGKKTCSE